MDDRVFIAINGNGLVRACGRHGEKFEVEALLPGRDVRCLAIDPLNQARIYAGTQSSGVLRSDDRGRTWRPAGLPGQVVKAVAVSAIEQDVLYAGTRPARMFVSRDGSDSWAELESFRHIPGRWFWFSPAEKPFVAYVQAIALSPVDPHRIAAGIEAGATILSDNGGKTWTRHLRGALRDCHSLYFHPRDGSWIYEAGGSGGGAAFSCDGGRTWTRAGAGLDRHYAWAVAADTADPHTWYVSASPGPMKAHSGNDAQAYIFRHDGAGWQRLAGGLPQPLNHMPYALITARDEPGSIYAGLSNGDIWHSDDRGANWRQLQINLGGIHRALTLA